MSQYNYNYGSYAAGNNTNANPNTTSYYSQNTANTIANQTNTTAGGYNYGGYTAGGTTTYQGYNTYGNASAATNTTTANNQSAAPSYNSPASTQAAAPPRPTGVAPNTAPYNGGYTNTTTNNTANAPAPYPYSAATTTTTNNNNNYNANSYANSGAPPPPDPQNYTSNPPAPAPNTRVAPHPLDVQQVSSSQFAYTPVSPLNDSSLHFARRAQERRVNLLKAPTPPRDIDYNVAGIEYPTTTNDAPLSLVDFVGIDDGNANPKFFRSMWGIIPATASIVKDMSLPFGAILAPLCRPLHQQEEVPLIQGYSPVRCTRCRGYMSCHVTFREMGRTWVCPFCEVSNEVSDQYFCNLDPQGFRTDREMRLELSRGSVEYDVDNDPEYAVLSEKGVKLPNRPLHHLFVIDISLHALNVFLPDYVSAIRDALQSMSERTPQAKVAFITFGTRVHFYNTRDPLLPQYCVADIENPFSPLPFGTLCWLEVGSEMERIELFLSRVVQYAQDAGEKDYCVVGAAVRTAMLVLAGVGGGRVILSTHAQAHKGVGEIKLREQHKLYGTDKEKELLQPIQGFWTTTAAEAARQNISFDQFVFSHEYCELATLSALSHVTNGHLYLFSKYDALVDSTKVHALMKQLTTEEAGYAAILRVRCSTGLKVKRYHGHYYSQNIHDMDLPAIAGSSSFFVEFEHEGKLPTNGYAYFQTALLYTTRSGHRRVRVQSSRFTVSDTYNKLFLSADLEATLCGALHALIQDAVNKGPAYARQKHTERIVKMFLTYRKYAGSSDASDSKILVMPRRLKLLLVLTVCAFKSEALTEGTTVRIDERVSSIFDLLSMPVNKLITYLYPALYEVHRLMDFEVLGTVNPVTGKCVLPPPRQLIPESIIKEGVYLLCDEQARLVYMWIGSLVPPECSQFLFGVDDANMVGRQGGPDESQFHERLTQILYAVTTRDDGIRKLIVLHEKDTMEDSFFKLLKEERDGTLGYSEYMYTIHQMIRNALA